MNPWRRVLLITVIAVAFAAIFLWWNRPHRDDMAGYAPADSLIYLEANSVKDLAAGIGSTNAWTTVAPILGTSANQGRTSWMVRVAGWTGLGPIETVVASRAQVAVVMLNLGTAEEGDTLRVKPELAVLIETHTSPFRIRSTVEQRLGHLAEGAYGQTSFKKTNANGVEFLTWTAASGSRELIAVIDGSLVIVGNSQNAVRKCLAVKHGEAPSLASDPELKLMRHRLADAEPLAFGYVSSANAARLVSIATPLFLGRNNNEPGFENLLANAAGKIFGTIGWGAFNINGLIEDRYLFTLQRPVIERLQPSFAGTVNSDPPLQFLSERPYSITDYRYRDPLAAWKGLESAGLARLDAVAAAVFKTLLDSAFVSYGVDSPEMFLKDVGPPLLTVRLQAGIERTLIIASIVNQEELRQFILGRLGTNLKRQSVGSVEIMQAADGEWGAAFVGEHLLLGAPEDVKRCLEKSAGSTTSVASFRDSLATTTPSAPIVTYTDDSERVRSFVRALDQATNHHSSLSTLEKVDQAIARLPYAITETSLGDDGIIRRTRSPLGQFSTFLGFVFPEKSD